MAKTPRQHLSLPFQRRMQRRREEAETDRRLRIDFQERLALENAHLRAWAGHIDITPAIVGPKRRLD